MSALSPASTGMPVPQRQSGLAPEPRPLPVPVTSQPQQTQQCYSSSYSSSPRQFPTELTDSILEEGVESGSESLIEPVTPVSGRHSQDFTTLQQQDGQNPQADQIVPGIPTTAPVKPSIITQTQAPTSHPANDTPASATTPQPQRVADSEPPTPGGLSRRSTRGSTSSFKRTMSNTMSSIFRRSNSHLIARDTPVFDSAPQSETNLMSPISNGGPPPSGRRFSNNVSLNTTRSNSPPSPGSPLEMTSTRSTVKETKALPAKEDFEKKTKRASTGFGLRGRAVNFGGNVRGGRPQEKNRRASSFDAGNNRPAGHPLHQEVNYETPVAPERLPWSLPPDSGTGVKARRMSLSLPDDFHVDVAELLNEYEYQSKLLGRHGKHLGKGAASKVTLMARKGCPTELYAVKEFRGKSGSETKEEYDKKIKSEFSIAKSLHHPNIVETFRLCTHHSRWNHVMEYCSEGDLFGLMAKGHLKGDAKLKDRLCIFKQIVQGINYLHANGIAHRDIKPDNCLITKDSKIKITDFGVSEVFSGTHPGLREAGGQCGQNMGELRLCSPGICGSEPYIAPEVLEKKANYDPRGLDVWGAGIIMIYMIFGGAVWNRAERGYPQYDKLADGWEKWYAKHPDETACINEMDYPKNWLFDNYMNPPALRRVVLQMLNPNPAKRITISQVINNRWVKNIECCQLESYDDPALNIDATRKDAMTKTGSRKIFCHNHLPFKSSGNHSLGPMPGQAGY